jgi:hypothetical protein
MIYGRDMTIHRTGEVNVELDKYGRVVSVWFRCKALPFTQTVVDDNRAEDMNDMYFKNSPKKIIAVEVED